MKPPIKKQILRHQADHMVNLNMDQQVCVIKTVAYRANTDTQTDRQTHRHMDRQKFKTEGPMILSIDIFYFKTVIIGGSIRLLSLFCFS